MRIHPPALAMQMAIMLTPAATLANPPASEAPPLVPAAYHSEHVTTRIVPGKPEQVKAWLEGRQIISFFPKDGKLPAIAKVEVLTPKWFETGGRRRVTFADGNTVNERVLVHDKSRFQYQIWGFTSAARFTVSYIDGAFDYRGEGPEQTRVTWTYRIKPRWSLLAWPVDSFLSGTFVPVMEHAMTAMADARRTDASK
jgi:hypothetical protein